MVSKSNRENNMHDQHILPETDSLAVNIFTINLIH